MQEEPVVLVRAVRPESYRLREVPETHRGISRAVGEVEGMEVRVLWLHGFVLWIENEPIMDEESQTEIRAAMKRLAPPGGAG